MKRFKLYLINAIRKGKGEILKILGRSAVKIVTLAAFTCVFTSCSSQSMTDFVQGEEGVLQKGIQDEAQYIEGILK